MAAVLLPTANAVMDAQSILPDQPDSSQSGVQWKWLFSESLFFLGVQHSFRLATEPQTRDNLPGRFFHDWGQAVGNIHGWADGDDFLINYVGHPMQGAVSGYIWVQNDGRYRTAEFGENRAYWKSRLRAAAFAWAYSEQFEIGPISEATIGKIQARYPQQGFVDHVITPSVGLGWMIAEDALDKYVITRIESHTQKRWIKVVARGGLNPSRSMANAMRLKVPWYRDTRPGIWRTTPGQIAQLNRARALRTLDATNDSPTRIIAPAATENSSAFPGDIPTFELAVNYSYFRLATGASKAQNCNGGGATAVWNISSFWGLAADVGGCKMSSPGHNVSGDSTTYLFGPRLAFHSGGRFTPYLQALIGGDKLTTETIYPNLKPSVIDVQVNSVAADTIHRLYTSHTETNNLAWQLGGGVDYAITRAIGWKFAEVNYLHIGAPDFNGGNFRDNITFTTGLILRFGSW